MPSGKRDGGDVGSHGVSSSCVLSSVSAEAHGSAYLLTQRSWMSRIGTGLRKCSFSRPRLRADDETGPLENLEVLHHPEARHRHPLLQGGQGLTVLGEQGVEQVAPGRVRKGLEYLVHSHDVR